MNLGWYELLDRIHLIQNAIQENVYEHQQTDAELQRMLDTAQESLSDAYQYAGKKFGVVEAKTVVNNSPNWAAIYCSEFKDYGDDEWNNAIDVDSSVDIEDLKRLVESHELVEKVGGLSIAKDFCRDFECIHIGLDLIECRRLIKAIADVESCNENPN